MSLSILLSITQVKNIHGSKKHYQVIQNIKITMSSLIKTQIQRQWVNVASKFGIKQEAINITKVSFGKECLI
ncbi:hypothetical protein J7E63_27505 [Bacillus sp. ISL-75]|nr:hypothetical protein [Bacillus sp. ISL-75]